MELSIRKLTTVEERYEAEHLAGMAFLEPWIQKDALKSAENPEGDVWAAFEGEKMAAVILTVRKKLRYEGKWITCQELHKVGSLPEVRGKGVVRRMMEEVLREYKAAGDLFSTLIPFSFGFYRKYGFELACEMLLEKTDIEQFSPFARKGSAEQILSQEQADEAGKLYENFILRYNLADARSEKDFAYREYGELGIRDWQYAHRTHYCYLFRDEGGEPWAYLTFVFVEGPDGPFTGMMDIRELIFNGPEALRSVFAFLYSMRAKIRSVKAELPLDVDLGILLPECDDVERSLIGYYTARALNIEKILLSLRHPQGSGTYRLRIADDFLPENTGTYEVSFAEGKALSAAKSEGEADLEVTIGTFTQLAAGFLDLSAACWKEGTRVRGQRELLEQIFVKKPVLLS